MSVSAAANLSSKSAPQKLDPMGAWLKEAYSYIGQNWLMLLKVYLWGMLMYFGSVMGLVLILAFSLFLTGVVVGLLGGQAWTPAITVVAGILWLALIVVVMGLAGKLILTQFSAIVAPVKDVKALWKKYKWQDGISFYWLLFLIAFAVYGGMFLLIIPGIIISISTSVALYVRFNQNVGGIKALMLSKDYIEGYWWQIFGRWLVAGLTVLGVGILPLLAYAKLTEMGGVWAVLGFVIYLLTIGIVTSVLYRLGQMLYLNLVKIKGELKIQPSGWRTFGWSLLVYFPLVFVVIAMGVLVAVNPAAQIQKAQMKSLQSVTPSVSPAVYPTPPEWILAK